MSDLWIQREKLDRIEEAMAHYAGAARWRRQMWRECDKIFDRKQQKETEMEGHDRKLDSP